MLKLNKRRSDRRRLSMEPLECRQMLTAAPFAVSLESMDVNSDGIVSPIDSLAVINALHSVSSESLDVSLGSTDVNGDGETSPIDALIILNELNGSVGAEPTPVVLATVAAAVATIGDYNGNCAVDQLDYNLWASTFGSTTQLAADGNGNGVVDAADFSLWRDNLGSGTCSSETVWRLTNREFNTHDLHAATDGNADLAPTGSLGTKWTVTVEQAGTTFQNVASGQYLAAGNFAAFTTATAGANARWDVVNNSDGSVALRNVATGRYLDGDGAADNWDVDESTAILQDDGWVVADLTAVGNADISGTVFSDADNNGQRLLLGAVYESGVAGRVVWVDLNENDTREAGEPTAVTDLNGSYLIPNAPYGDSTIRIEAAVGWAGSTPIERQVTLTTDGAVVDFGQHSPAAPYVSLSGPVKFLNRETLEYLYVENCANGTHFIGTYPTAEVTAVVCDGFRLTGTDWNAISNEHGTLLQNVGAINYLVSPASWELTFDDPAGSPPAGSPFYWGILLNADGSISFQNKVTGQYLDADSDSTTDLSESLLPDDSWYVVY